MRYTKFLLDLGEIPFPPQDGKGLVIAKNDISELEQCENRNQDRLFEALYSAITELFELSNIEMHTTGYSNALFLITNDETDFNAQRGFLSPELSRKKLKEGDPREIAGAIIDLLVNRDTWTTEKTYFKLSDK